MRLLQVPYYFVKYSPRFSAGTTLLFSMLAAQQNLKDAGYREKSLLLDDKDEDEDPSKIEIEEGFLISASQRAL